MNKFINKKSFLIILCIIIFVFLIFFSVKKHSSRSFLKTMSFEETTTIEISSREKTISSNNVELINNFKYIIQKIAEGKDAYSKMNREMRNVYVFTIIKDMNTYKIHISYPDSKEYLYVYIESKKFSTNLCCELQKEDWDVFIRFIDHCNKMFN